MATTIKQNFERPFSAVEFDPVKEPYGNSICNLQSWCTDGNKCSVGTAPWGVPQSLVLVSGEEWVAGCSWASIPGDDMKAKQNHVNTAEADALWKLFRAEGSGFMLKLKAGHMTLLPSQYLLLHITGADGSSGVRWGLVPTDQVGIDAVKQVLNDLIAAFPALGTSDYHAWLTKLGTPLVPIA